MVMMEYPIDKSALESLARQGGSALTLKAIDQFLDKVPQRMEAACDRGRAGDLSAVEQALQSIRSAAGIVGATEVSQFASRIERLAVEGAREKVLPLLCQLDEILNQAVAWLQKEKTSLGRP
jgi:HPt (histidine-containing phosphotransfer) domain-containing protein